MVSIDTFALVGWIRLLRETSIPRAPRGGTRIENVGEPRWGGEPIPKYNRRPPAE